MMLANGISFGFVAPFAFIFCATITSLPPPPTD
jgi:hypothetical protein